MTLSISGMPGSGKTSAGKIVAEKLGMSFHSTGGIFRQMAQDRGITINELMKLGETDGVIHTKVDDYQKQLGLDQDNFVIEGRLSWHFIPHSFKVLLLCDTKEAARRIYDAKQTAEAVRSVDANYTDLEEAERLLIERNDSDIIAYHKLYGINYADPKHFDLVLDTTTTGGPEETANKILQVLATQ